MLTFPYTCAAHRHVLSRLGGYAGSHPDVGTSLGVPSSQGDQTKGLAN